MRGKTCLFVDQYGNRWFAKTVKELRSKIGMGGSRVGKMFRDTANGGAVHVGYVIGRHWCEAFMPIRIPV